MGETDSNNNNRGLQHPITSMDRGFKVHIRSDELNRYIDHSFQKQQKTFFSSAHATFFRLDHMLGNKTSLSNLRNPTKYLF